MKSHKADIDIVAYIPRKSKKANVSLLFFVVFNGGRFSTVYTSVGAKHMKGT